MRRLRMWLAAVLIAGAVAPALVVPASQARASSSRVANLTAASIVPAPTKADCATAKKILTQWRRLAQKLGVRLSPARLRELERKTQDGTISFQDLPATLRRNFPAGFIPWNLNQIINICNGLPPGNGHTVIA